MRGLFFKVFIIFWIAQSMIFVISTALIVRHHFERPDAAFEALYSSLQNDAAKAAVLRSTFAPERYRCESLGGIYMFYTEFSPPR